MKKLVKLWGIALALGMNPVLAEEYTVGQHNKTFVLEGKKIEHLTVMVGSTIHFKNMDPWFHNVFSLSELKTFDLGSYPQGQSKSVTFDKPGQMEIECAIHPQMLLKLEIKEKGAK